MNRIEEQRSRVLSQFDEQSRSLRRLTLFFLAPALLFGVFVFLPFTQQVSSADRMQAELDSARIRLAATADTLPRIAAVDSLLGVLSLEARLRGELDFRFELATDLEGSGEVGAERLAMWAAGTADIDLSDPGERLRPGELAARRISACVWLDDRRWRDCFSVTGDRTGACIGRGCVVYPDGVSYVPGAPAGPLDEALAAELVDSLNASKRAIVEDLPPLSDVLSEGFPDWGSGYERARLAFEGISARVSDRRRAVRQAVSALEGDTAALASGLERARSLISVIEQSGSSFTTPLGPLPVGIRELVFLYPALLGVAYLLCLASFRRLVTLRRVFHLLTLEVGGEEATQGPLSVSLTAPLWYEPLDARWSQAGNLILALAPLVLMVWSYLALRLGLAALVDGADSRLAPVWYDLFFWVACIGVGLAFARAAWTVRSYRARPPGSFAS